MSYLSDRIHYFIDDDRSAQLLAKYYRGRYAGSRFDTAPQLRSPDPDRFTVHDFAAVATLSVPLSGRAVVDLLEHEETLGRLLSEVSKTKPLVEAGDEDLEPLFALQSELDGIADVGHVSRSKLLAHKRPRLVPIRDPYVLTALVSREFGDFTVPLRDALRSDPSILKRLAELRQMAGVTEISDLRTLDVVVWMAVHGNSRVTDD